MHVMPCIMWACFKPSQSRREQAQPRFSGPLPPPPHTHTHLHPSGLESLIFSEGLPGGFLCLAIPQHPSAKRQCNKRVAPTHVQHSRKVSNPSSHASHHFNVLAACTSTLIHNMLWQCCCTCCCSVLQTSLQTQLQKQQQNYKPCTVLWSHICLRGAQWNAFTSPLYSTLGPLTNIIYNHHHVFGASSCFSTN